MLNNGADLKPCLSLKSTLQESIRSLFFYGAEYLAVSEGSGEFLCHKDALIALLERGDGVESLGQLVLKNGSDSIKGKMSLETEPLDKRVLILDSTGLHCETLLDFRQSRLIQKEETLPSWWGIPLPMLKYSNRQAKLNPRAGELISVHGENLDPLVARAIADRDMVLQLPESFGGKAFAMTMIDRDVFFLEDISGDAEMAEKLVWWAAVGRAFVNRMEKNGLMIHQHQEPDSVPEGALEVLSCCWEENPLGFISITQKELPSEIADSKAEIPQKIGKKRKTTHEDTARKKTGRTVVSDG